MFCLLASVVACSCEKDKNCDFDGAYQFEIPATLSPALDTFQVGDTIHFKATDAAHNSVSVDGMVPVGASSWASQLSQDISITLDTEGVYVYQCDPHLIMAMVGVIQVGEAVNMDEIKSAASSYSSNFLMNNDRLQSYLSQL